jgi:oligopeptide/dipeptide ABC transporter ATP-binding protein
VTEESLLSVRGLSTVVRAGGREWPVVKEVSFDVRAGETVGFVGESGSGKSMTMLSLAGLLPQPAARVVSGQVLFEGRDLQSLDDEERRKSMGSDLAMVFQDPMATLNPLMRVGEQIEEGMRAHGIARADARRRMLEVLDQVGISQPVRASRSFPHEFSGGMRQRVLIAAALALRPRLLIADEATSALDVTIQQQIVELVRDLQREEGMAVIWISHDMGVIARVASQVLVMYAGHIVEHGAATSLFRTPQHPYTAALLGSIPAVDDDRGPLVQIGGRPPEIIDVPRGCPFAPRCPERIDRCVEMPPLTTRAPGTRAACWVPPERWVA